MADTFRSRATDTKKHIADTNMTRQNWYKHISWLNVTFIIGIPIYGCIQALWVHLQLKTAIWAVIYYFFTGLSITAGIFDRPQAAKVLKLTMWQDIIVSGLTPPTQPLSLSASGSSLWALVPWKAPSAGGLVITVLTIDTLTPTRTPTPSARVFYTRILAGWS